MRLIVITPEHTLPGERTAIDEMFAKGLQRLHVRKPLLNKNDYGEYIHAFEEEHRSKIVIHSCFDLYEELGAGGVHLSSYARDNGAAWEQIRHVSPERISTSFHSWQEIMDNTFPYGYVFISPVFDSISKSGYRAGIDISKASEIKTFLKQTDRFCPQIIGLGGVGEQQIKPLMQHGFDGVALLGAIWTDANPVKKFEQIKKAISDAEDH